MHVAASVGLAVRGIVHMKSASWGDTSGAHILEYVEAGMMTTWSKHFGVKCNGVASHSEPVKCKFWRKCLGTPSG